MTDYTKLVEALRLGSDYGVDEEDVERLCADAADAIVALGLDNEDYEHENRRLHGEIEALQDTIQAQDKALKECARQLAKMGPKHGEWVEDATTYAGPCLSNYKCSLCGKICGTWRRGLKPSELPNWCGNCGADMRKMEVQE